MFGSGDRIQHRGFGGVVGPYVTRDRSRNWSDIVHSGIEVHHGRGKISKGEVATNIQGYDQVQEDKKPVGQENKRMSPVFRTGGKIYTEAPRRLPPPDMPGARPLCLDFHLQGFCNQGSRC